MLYVASTMVSSQSNLLTARQLLTALPSPRKCMARLLLLHTPINDNHHMISQPHSKLQYRQYSLQMCTCILWHTVVKTGVDLRVIRELARVSTNCSEFQSRPRNQHAYLHRRKRTRTNSTDTLLLCGTIARAKARI